MIFEEAASVWHSEKCDFKFLGLEVQLCLDVHAHRAGAFIQNGEDGLMVEESSHRDSLFLTTGKHIVPIVDWIETFLSLLNVVQFHPFQQLTDLLISVGDSLLWVRVNNLVSECSWGEVGALWDVEQLVHVWSFEDTSCKRPKTAEDSEQWRLSAAVGAGDDSVHSWSDLKRNFLDEDVAVGRDDGHLIEHDVIFSLFGGADVDGVDIVFP